MIFSCNLRVYILYGTHEAGDYLSYELVIRTVASILQRTDCSNYITLRLNVNRLLFIGIYNI